MFVLRVAQQDGQVFEDVEETLKKLQQRAYHLGVITNSDKRAGERLVRSRESHRFTRVKAKYCRLWGWIASLALS
jgi:FMN phosphatase YigB (HAD superfamily)